MVDRIMRLVGKIILKMKIKYRGNDRASLILTRLHEAAVLKLGDSVENFTVSPDVPLISCALNESENTIGLQIITEFNSELKRSASLQIFKKDSNCCDLPTFKIGVSKVNSIIDQELQNFKIAGKSKFGGSPDWINKESKPVCRKCHNTMTFFAQLDSFGYYSEFLADTDASFFNIGDQGMIFIFFCSKCNASKSLVQFY
jgi:hypothetical protein